MMTSEADENYDEKIEKMVTMTVAAAKGIVPLGQIALPIAQISQSHLAPPEARDFAKALTRILQGERDPLTLVEDLTPTLAEAVWDTLAQIEEPLPEWDEVEREALTFEQLIEKVAEACTGEVMLWQQLWTFTQELEADLRLAPEIRTLGTVLQKILAGERQAYLLDELAPEHHWAVAELLAWLNERAVAPPEISDPPVDEA
jgi:hypothetical protein